MASGRDGAQQAASTRSSRGLTADGRHRASVQYLLTEAGASAGAGMFEDWLRQQPTLQYMSMLGRSLAVLYDCVPLTGLVTGGARPVSTPTVSMSTPLEMWPPPPPDAQLLLPPRPSTSYRPGLARSGGGVIWAPSSARRARDHHSACPGLSAPHAGAIHHTQDGTRAPPPPATASLASSALAAPQLARAPSAPCYSCGRWASSAPYARSSTACLGASALAVADAISAAHARSSAFSPQQLQWHLVNAPRQASAGGKAAVAPRARGPASVGGGSHSPGRVRTCGRSASGSAPGHGMSHRHGVAADCSQCRGCEEPGVRLIPAGEGGPGGSSSRSRRVPSPGSSQPPRVFTPSLGLQSPWVYSHTPGFFTAPAEGARLRSPRRTVPLRHRVPSHSPPSSRQDLAQGMARDGTDGAAASPPVLPPRGSGPPGSTLYAPSNSHSARSSPTDIHPPPADMALGISPPTSPVPFRFCFPTRSAPDAAAPPPGISPAQSQDVSPAKSPDWSPGWCARSPGQSPGESPGPRSVPGDPNCLVPTASLQSRGRRGSPAESVAAPCADSSCHAASGAAAAQAGWLRAATPRRGAPRARTPRVSTALRPPLPLSVRVPADEDTNASPSPAARPRSHPDAAARAPTPPAGPWAPTASQGELAISPAELAISRREPEPLWASQPYTPRPPTAPVPHFKRAQLRSPGAVRAVAGASRPDRRWPRLSTGPARQTGVASPPRAAARPTGGSRLEVPMPWLPDKGNGRAVHAAVGSHALAGMLFDMCQARD